MSDVSNLPTAALEDLIDGGLSYVAPTMKSPNQLVEVPFYVAIDKAGSVWAYFTDQHVETFGEVARQLIP